VTAAWLLNVGNDEPRAGRVEALRRMNLFAHYDPDTLAVDVKRALWDGRLCLVKKR
jgi:hypothetical protein